MKHVLFFINKSITKDFENKIQFNNNLLLLKFAKELIYMIHVVNNSVDSIVSSKWLSYFALRQITISNYKKFNPLKM